MTDKEFPRTLDPSILSEDVRRMKDFVLSKIAGQDRAVGQFVKVLQMIMVGLNKPNRPAGVFLFTGPTGVGKTETVRATAEALLGSKDALTRVDCGEYQHSHEISKLIGSPPGYVGYTDREAIRLSQDKIDKFQTRKYKINFVLFDEIEEAHPALLAVMLQILDAGRLTLGTGGTVDFSKTIVVLTSNLGEKDAQKVMAGTQLGLAPVAKNSETTDQQVYKASKAAATKHFQAKFMNRVDRVVVFRSLAEDSLRKILKIELADLQYRIWETALTKWASDGSAGQLNLFRPVIRTTKAAEDLLIKEGTSRTYGARELNRAIDRFMTFPLAALIGSKQIASGDEVEADHEDGKRDLTFRITGHRDVAPLPPVKYDGSPAAIVNVKDLPVTEAPRSSESAKGWTIYRPKSLPSEKIQDPLPRKPFKW